MGRPTTETIMEALFAALQAGMQVEFTATTAENSTVLASPSSLSGLQVGFPVFGSQIPSGAAIATVTPTLTLTLPATAAGTAAALTAGCQTFGRRVKHLE